MSNDAGRVLLRSYDVHIVAAQRIPGAVGPRTALTCGAQCFSKPENFLGSRAALATMPLISSYTGLNASGGLGASEPSRICERWLAHPSASGLHVGACSVHLEATRHTRPCNQDTVTSTRQIVLMLMLVL